MAQLAVAAAGAAVGSLFGAPQAGWLVGSFIGAALFAGGQQQKVEGPRFGDLQVQASTYGMGIPQVFGSMRVVGESKDDAITPGDLPAGGERRHLARKVLAEGAAGGLWSSLFR